MGKSVVVRDLNKMLQARGIEADINTIIQENFGSNFYSDMNSRKAELNTLDKNLSSAESELRAAFTDSVFDTDSIIHGIQMTSFSGNMTGANILMSLYGGFENDLLDQRMLDALSNYNSAYSSYFNTFVDDAQYISKVGQSIRNDQMYYTIGIETSNGSLKEYVLNSEQWGQISADRELFSLTRGSNGQISLSLNRGRDYFIGQSQSEWGLSADTLASKIESITGISSIGAYGQGTSAIRQEIWDKLKTSEIFSSSSIARFANSQNEEDLRLIKDSRKYELLNENIWGSVYDSSLTPEQRSLEIDRIIGGYAGTSGSGYLLDNIFSGARGDNLLAGPDGQLISTQQKYFGSGGTEFGFGVISFGALNNALGFYGNKQNIDNNSEKALNDFMESDKGQAILNKAEELLMYKEAAYMLADIGILDYNEAEEIGQEVDDAIETGDYDEDTDADDFF